MNAATGLRLGAAVGAAKAKRRYELDLLRGLVVLVLIPYHTATYFIGGLGPGFWAPLRFTPNPAIQILISLATVVAMPLMFFIAGMGANHSLRKRTAAVFVGERLRRLLVPLIVGHLTLLPIITYYELSRSPLYDETFARFYPSFFSDLTVKLVFPPALSGPRYLTHHLWFLKDLLIYSLLLLPLFLWLRSGSGRRTVERVGAFLSRPWAIWLLAIPVAAIEAGLGSHSAWNRFSYIVLLLYGFLVAAHPLFAKAIQGAWKWGLALGFGLFCTVAVGGIFYFTSIGVDFLTDPGLPSVLFRGLKAAILWFLLVGLMGLGAHFVTSKEGETGAPQQVAAKDSDGGPILIERTSRMLSGATLPIYVIHLAVVIVVGFYVLQLTTSMWARFLVITPVSLLDTLALYDILRRTQLTRVLVGMKAKPSLDPDTSQSQSTPTRTAGGWIKSNLPQVGLWASAALVTLLLVLVASWAGDSLVGRWEQTLDTLQPATGYVAEFREDGTWTATAESHSLDGTYALIDDHQVEIVYPDGTTSVARFRTSPDRFALISLDIERQQVFIRVP